MGSKVDQEEARPRSGDQSISFLSIRPGCLRILVIGTRLPAPFATNAAPRKILPSGALVVSLAHRCTLLLASGEAPDQRQARKLE